MKSKKNIAVITLACILVIVFVSILVKNTGFENGEPKESTLTLEISDRREVKKEQISSHEVGTGWGTGNAEEAVKNAVSMALEGKEKKAPDFAIVYATSGSQIDKVFKELRRNLGPDTKIYGGTSDSRAVVTESKYVEVFSQGYTVGEDDPKNGIAVMTVSSEEMIFGAGSADYTKFSSVFEAAESAAKQAVNSAGKTSSRGAKVIFVTPTYGDEEQVLEGIERVFGKDIVIIGGTTGGPEFGVFGNEAVYSAGLSLAVLYTELPVGWVFEAGFEGTEKSGYATKVDKNCILEIDDKPALEVYDQWLNGKIAKLQENGESSAVIRDLLTLNPLFRRFEGKNGKIRKLYSHPWPRYESPEDQGIMTSTKILEGEKIFQSYGTWEILLNRIGQLPAKARQQGKFSQTDKIIFGFSVICGGVLGTIPAEERSKIPCLINYTNNDAPFIGTFSWGEQGRLAGVGNKHGNLTTSFLVVGERKDK